MHYRVRAAAFAAACVLAGGMTCLAVQTLMSLGSERLFEQSESVQVGDAEIDSVDSLDPNDCSRGVDESNQETCGEELAQ